MSKGEELGRLLDEAEVISSQMNHLFLKNNLTLLDLNRLPKEDKIEWYRLKAIHEDLGNQMCCLINRKD